MSIAVRRRNGHTAAAGVETEVPPVPFDHEEFVVRRGTRSDCYVMVAVHSTTLGPALGGVRLWHYRSAMDASRDALRLAEGMTMKAAAAGLDLGGGKGVICAPRGAPPTGPDRQAMLLDFGDLVESLDGRYITAEDVGISPEDLVTISDRTTHLTGLPPDRGGSGDPSPFTADGVQAAMRACAAARFGTPDLSGCRIVVLGMGHVGERLAELLSAAGAELVVSDIVAEKQSVAKRLGAEWVEPAAALTTQCDILAPCALGGTVDGTVLPRLRCEIVCGSANNQLAEPGLDEALAERGVLYAPDFIVNAGGLIHVYMEIRRYSEDHARQLVLGIEATMGQVLRTAAERKTTPLRAAAALARERLATHQPVRV
jgi:leucine dehydrogenase